MAALATGISLATTALSTVMAYQGTIAQGNAAKKAAQIEAEQMRREGTARLAESQQVMNEKDLEMQYALSELQANAAASGFSATDTTSLNLLGDIAQRGEFQKGKILASGMNQRIGMQNQAAAREWAGKVAKQNSRMKSKGILLDGISTFAKSAGIGDFKMPGTDPLDITPNYYG